MARFDWFWHCYLIPLNFRAPLIFAHQGRAKIKGSKFAHQGCAKIRGARKVFLGARKLKGAQKLEGVLFFAHFWCSMSTYQLHDKITRENILWNVKKKYLNGTNEWSNRHPSIDLAFTEGNGRYIFSWKKFVYSSIDKKISPQNLKFIEKIFDWANYWKFIENLKNLGGGKIKGARNGSDARKLEAQKLKARK